MFAAAAEIFADHGHELTHSDWADTIGRHAPDWDLVGRLEALTGRRLDGQALLERRRRRERELVLALDLLPGVRTWVAAARDRGLRLAIASSSTRSWVTGHLGRLGLLDGWDAICCRDDVERAKPAPDLYLAALAAIGLPPSRALAIEDSPNGIAAAKAAGLYCIAVPGPMTRSLDLSRADRVLASLADVDLDRFLSGS